MTYRESRADPGVVDGAVPMRRPGGERSNYRVFADELWLAAATAAGGPAVTSADAGEMNPAVTGFRRRLAALTVWGCCGAGQAGVESPARRSAACLLVRIPKRIPRKGEAQGLPCADVPVTLPGASSWRRLRA